MIFTLILDLEASRKAKEASKARRRKIRHLKKQQRMRQLLVKQALTFVLAFLLIVVDQTVFSHKAIKTFGFIKPPPRVRHFGQSRTVITSNNLKGVV